MSVPAGGTVPGTHLVEYTLESCCSTACRLSMSFISWHILYFVQKC